MTPPKPSTRTRIKSNNYIDAPTLRLQSYSFSAHLLPHTSSSSLSSQSSSPLRPPFARGRNRPYRLPIRPTPITPPLSTNDNETEATKKPGTPKNGCLAHTHTLSLGKTFCRLGKSLIQRALIGSRPHAAGGWGGSGAFETHG